MIQLLIQYYVEVLNMGGVGKHHHHQFEKEHKTFGIFFTKLKLSSTKNNLSQYVGENMRAIDKAQVVSIWRRLKHNPKTKKYKLPIKLKLFPFGDGLNSILKKSFIYSSTFSLNYLGECIF